MSVETNQPPLAVVDSLAVDVLTDNVSDTYVSKTTFAVSEFANVVLAGATEISGETLLAANLGYGLRLRSKAGTREHTMLFDTGTEGAVFINNRALDGIDGLTFMDGILYANSVIADTNWRIPVDATGKAGNPVTPQIINLSDLTRPVYGDNGNYYTDLWIGYTRKIASDKIVMSVRLNCNDAFENGHLVPTLVNLDGTPWAYRIIDPRQWILSLKFTF